MKKLFIICILMLSPVLSGCGMIIGTMGVTGTILEIFNGVSVATTAYDVGAIALDEKTLSDNAISAVMDKNCRMIRLLKNKQICLTEVQLASTTRDYWDPTYHVETPPIW